MERPFGVAYDRKHGLRVIAACQGCRGKERTFTPISLGDGEFRHDYSILMAFDGRGNPEPWQCIEVLVTCGVCTQWSLARFIQHRGSRRIGDPQFPIDYEAHEIAPAGVPQAEFPNETPAKVVSLLRESEVCLAHGALRGAAALLRATLETLLIANGYEERNLLQKIDAAANDQILTVQLKKRAHSLRVLANDSLHEAAQVARTDVVNGYEFAQRIVEAFYFTRQEVVEALKAVERIK
jgi:hypothetical protein